MAQQDGQVHKVLGSEALGILLGRWRDGTFSGIADDWRWIAGYTKRYRWAVALYIVLGVAESSLSLCPPWRGNTPSISSRAIRPRGYGCCWC